MFDFYPEKTYSRTEVMSRPTPVLAVNSVYFWWFKEIPRGVPTEGCITAEGYAPLYVGISPDKRGKPNSRSNLRKRLKTHYSGNAAGSALRRTLGVLLTAAKDEFLIIKNVSRDDMMAAHRVPPQMMGIMPSNVGWGCGCGEGQPRFCSQ